MDISVLICVKI